jgi:leucyl-tRNA synthetase
VPKSDVTTKRRIDEAIEAAINALEARKIGARKVNFKLRDWVFSRQRYWGEPIPILHCPKCGAVPVDEKDLPGTLPEVERYQPTETGDSPLADIPEWVNQKCPSCGGPAKRETNTMPQWAGSSWYFLRYLDPRNDKELAGAESLELAPVDMYVGGIEHAILHLLYSRFYTKFLYDIKVLKFEEPFKILFNQGMILRKGKKMSKSAGNVVSPDELVNKYGCDSLRMYELFAGPPELDMEWNDNGIDGVYRFLNKTWKLINENAARIIPPNKDLERARHKAVYDITTRIENLSMNTVVSGMMETVNAFADLAKTYNGLDKESMETICILLSPLAPNIAEEMWEILGRSKSVFEEKWPEYDKEKTRAEEIELAVQLNGKYRASVMIPYDSGQDFAATAAKTALGARLCNLDVVKEIYVKNKLINIVARKA